jgi:anti-sigma regulatory factor (Ser/Thr protein kinase)
MSVEQGEAEHSGLSRTRVEACDLDVVHVGGLRRLVRRLLGGHADVMTEDAVLVADELASNALRHGTSDRSCRLALFDRGRLLRIEVSDTSPRMPQFRTPDQHGGRGLILVDRLTASWGVRRHAGHKTVWAEVVVDRPAGAGARHLAVAGAGPRLSTSVPTRK